jgi:hypothetical protein
VTCSLALMPAMVWAGSACDGCSCGFLHPVEALHCPLGFYHGGTAAFPLGLKPRTSLQKPQGRPFRLVCGWGVSLCLA